MKDKNLKEVTLFLNEQELRDIRSSLLYLLYDTDMRSEVYRRRAFLLDDINETIKAMKRD